MFALLHIYMNPLVSVVLVNVLGIAISVLLNEVLFLWASLQIKFSIDNVFSTLLAFFRNHLKV